MLINNYLNSKEDYRNKKIIFVRGTASSGKSSLCAELGNKLQEYFMIFPLEDVVFFSMIPSKYLVNGKESDRGFSIKRDEDDNITEVNSSPWCNTMYLTYLSTIEKYTKEGLNIICDGNFIDENSLKMVMNYVPEDYTIYIFSLNVALNLLVNREQTRLEQRTPGFAKHQHQAMSSSFYLDDLTIKITDNTTIAQAANQVASYYENHKGHNKKEIYERFK